jgi:D-3-phosphoglycerate dehydrogenase
LVFAHLFTAVRFLYDSNRQMPVNGSDKFEELKKKYAKGIELRNKTIGIIGFGRIGQNVAKMAFGLGMRVVAYDPFVKEVNIQIDMNGVSNILEMTVHTSGMAELLNHSDFITVHVPGGELLGETEIAQMKKGAILVNTARGGVINEGALVAALNSGHLAHACLDVFQNEPKPSATILTHPKISLSPHIGAATNEAQERIGIELAEKLIEALK